MPWGACSLDFFAIIDYCVLTNSPIVFKENTLQSILPTMYLVSNGPHDRESEENSLLSPRTKYSSSFNWTFTDPGVCNEPRYETSSSTNASLGSVWYTTTFPSFISIVSPGSPTIRLMKRWEGSYGNFRTMTSVRSGLRNLYDSSSTIR